MSNLPANIAGMLTGLQQTHHRVKTTSGAEGAMFLKLTKAGYWAFGPEEIEVQQGSQWAIGPSTFQHGYVAWEQDAKKAAAKLGEEMRPAYEPAINVANLPDVGAPWDQQLGMGLICINGDDKGTNVVYTTTSKGGVRAINTLLGALIERIQSGEDDTIVPIATLGVDSYQHKRYGTVYVPDIKIVRWASRDETMESQPKAEAQPAAQPEAQPAAQPATPPARAARYAVNAQPPADPTPRRRRRAVA